MSTEEKKYKKTELKHIAIEGVIGAGKTSLARKLAESMGAKLVEEEFENNPFLADFYKDQDAYAFQTQMFFLINRYKQQQKLPQGDLFTECIVSDYIFEKDRIFAYLNLNNDELKLYESIFPLLHKEVPRVDLVVYLQSSVERLMYNIRLRNRKIETDISAEYINELSEAYNNFFFKYSETPLLIVNSSEIDFVNNDSDFNELYKQIFREDRGFIEYFKPPSSFKL